MKNIYFITMLENHLQEIEKSLNNCPESWEIVSYEVKNKDRDITIWIQNRMYGSHITVGTKKWESSSIGFWRYIYYSRRFKKILEIIDGMGEKNRLEKINQIVYEKLSK